jgi:hypothetical protein
MSALDAMIKARASDKTSTRGHFTTRGRKGNEFADGLRQGRVLNVE